LYISHFLGGILYITERGPAVLYLAFWPIWSKVCQHHFRTGFRAFPRMRNATTEQGDDEPARQKAGFFTKRHTQVSPSDMNTGRSNGLRNTLRSRLSISTGTGGGFVRNPSEDIEMQRSERKL